MKQPDTKRVFSAKRDGAFQAIVCYNCVKRGHYARDFRSKRKDELLEGNGCAQNIAGGQWQAAVGHG
jgi:hypothetical protein